MKKIPLTRGLSAVVSDEHYPIFGQFKWYAKVSSATDVVYAARDMWPGGGLKVMVQMHREVLALKLGRPLEAGEVPDHKDGDGLNNLPGNLRVATYGQNSHNTRSRRDSSSKYKGVSWDANRSLWLAQIKLNGKQKNLGRYADEIEAAKVYDRIAKQHWGEFAYLNFPNPL